MTNIVIAAWNTGRAYQAHGQKIADRQVARGERCPECGGVDTESNGAAEYRCVACDHRWGTEPGGETYGF